MIHFFCIVVQEEEEFIHMLKDYIKGDDGKNSKQDDLI